MEVLLFTNVCTYSPLEDTTKIFGQTKHDMEFDIVLDTELKVRHIKSNAKGFPDFCIEIGKKINYIKELNFFSKDKKIHTMNDISLVFPFENCDLQLTQNSAIVTIMCKDYSCRLEEWIQYNINLGFSGIIIFDNDANENARIKEPLGNRVYNGSVKEVCKKYKGKVCVVDFSYQSWRGAKYNTIQRMTYDICLDEFRNKCARIALVDADEFIYLPKNPNMSIETFLMDYSGNNVTIKSNILTNESNNDLINNNVLDLALYVGENKYTKTIIDTSLVNKIEFIKTMHGKHPEVKPSKEDIIHYHCWMNERYPYTSDMVKIDFLKNIKETYVKNYAEKSPIILNAKTERKICASHKSDGFGAQYWANMTCFAYCRNNNYIYRHIPYTRIAHYKNAKDLVPKVLNEFTGLKSDKDDDVKRKVDDQRAWTFPYAQKNSQWFTPQICKELRDMYNSTPKPEPIKCDVAIHIRRGDIREGNGRYISLHFYGKVIEKFKQKNPDYRVVVFSEGVIEDFKELEQKNVTFVLNGDTQLAFHSMVKAKNFVMGYSCFSLCPAILNENQVYYYTNNFNKLDHWIDVRLWIG
tara:strand:+ start:5663 stop:7405 length:1743 start_codon:yes stop_codon:yes gene_type:complete